MGLSVVAQCVSLIDFEHATSRPLRSPRQDWKKGIMAIIFKLVSDVHILDRLVVCLAEQASRDSFTPGGINKKKTCPTPS